VFFLTVISSFLLVAYTLLVQWHLKQQIKHSEIVLQFSSATRLKAIVQLQSTSSHPPSTPSISTHTAINNDCSLHDVLQSASHPSINV
jgi:hypothetical protein